MASLASGVFISPIRDTALLIPIPAKASAMEAPVLRKRQRTAMSRAPTARASPVTRSLTRIFGSSRQALIPAARASVLPDLYFPCGYQRSITGPRSAGSSSLAGTSLTRSAGIPCFGKARANRSDVSRTSAGRLRHDFPRVFGLRPPRILSMAAFMSSGSEPRNPKMDCFWSPTQTLLLAISASFRKMSNWIGLVSWNSSTRTRSKTPSSRARTSGLFSNCRAGHVLAPGLNISLLLPHFPPCPRRSKIISRNRYSAVSAAFLP